MEIAKLNGRYYPPTPGNLAVLSADIELCTELNLPTNLQIIVNELTMITDWCNDQNPARRTESSIYESIIINLNSRIDQIRDKLAVNSGYFYSDTV